VSMNLTIIGRVGKDPEVRYSASGVATCRFSVAVNRRKKVGEEWTDETLWMDLTCFKDLAENAASSVSKGSEIIAHGYLEEIRTYEKKDGTLGVSLPFIANDLGLSLRWNAATPIAGSAPTRKPTHSEEPF